MTRKEMTEIFSVMLLAWPNAEMFKGGLQKLGPTIELWAACLCDVDFVIAQKAVVLLCKECKFPPSIAEFRDKVDIVHGEITARVDTAWDKLMLGLRLGRSPQEIYNKLPRDSRTRSAIDAIGGPGEIVVTETVEFANGRTEKIDQYNYHAFANAYKHALRQARAIDDTRHKAASFGAKQIGGKTDEQK